jgi:hypothetical protein
LHDATAYFFAASLLASDGVAGDAPDGADDDAPDEELDDGLAGVLDDGLDGAGVLDAGGVAPVFGVDESFFWQAVSANAASMAAATRSVRFIFCSPV